MKKLIILLALFNCLIVFGQNEFAATSFYTAFKKVYDDKEKGFETYKGNKVKAKYEALADEYRSKLLLPLSDSGKIVVPKSGRPYAIFYFETEKKKEKIDERAVNLRDAISTAYAKPLFARTTTTKVGDHFFSDTYFYTEEKEDNTAKALFRINVFYEAKRYHLSLEIKGPSN